MSCKYMAKDGEPLCEVCKRRPTKSKYQALMIHGLVTEPIPEGSKVYGSPYYWETVALYGDPEEECKRGAARAQLELERFFLRRGIRPWRVQRPSDEELEIMVKGKGTGNGNAKGKEKEKVPEKPASTLMTSGFTIIKKMYEESEKKPERLPIDTMEIVKTTLNGRPVWRAENGMVFSVDAAGQPDELLEFNPT
jgi:hypothetical protein